MSAKKVIKSIGDKVLDAETAFKELDWDGAEEHIGSACKDYRVWMFQQEHEEKKPNLGTGFVWFDEVLGIPDTNRIRANYPATPGRIFHVRNVTLTRHQCTVDARYESENRYLNFEGWTLITLDDKPAGEHNRKLIVAWLDENWVIRRGSLIDETQHYRQHGPDFKYKLFFYRCIRAGPERVRDLAPSNPYKNGPAVQPNRAGPADQPNRADPAVQPNRADPAAHRDQPSPPRRVLRPRR